MDQEAASQTRASLPALIESAQIWAANKKPRRSGASGVGTSENAFRTTRQERTARRALLLLSATILVTKLSYSRMVSRKTSKGPDLVLAAASSFISRRYSAILFMGLSRTSGSWEESPAEGH